MTIVRRILPVLLAAVLLSACGETKDVLPEIEQEVKQEVETVLEEYLAPLRTAGVDTLVLGCTHYPLLMSSVVKNVPKGVRIMSQGTYVANSLADYLKRHPEMERNITQGGTCRYLTTESEERFSETARIFLHEDVTVNHVDLTE